jgi:hypothetical protein
MATLNRFRHRTVFALVILPIAGLTLARTAPAAARTPSSTLVAQDSIPLRLDSSYAIHSCAPSDGPAVTLYLGATVTGSGMTLGVKPPFVEITVWKPWSTLGGATFVLEHYHGGGFASYCATEKGCEHLDFARVTFNSAIEDRLSGTAELTIRGRQMTVPFNARRLDIRMMCG